MICLEAANIIISVVSLVIALVALFQTSQQIALSNKHLLFDRRLSCFLEFNTIYELYTSNKIYLKNNDSICYINDLIFSWLTNCSELEEMYRAMEKPLHHEEQKLFLTRYEKIKTASIEISMIFDGDAAKIASEFVFLFAELLKAMYQQQVFISEFKGHEAANGESQSHDVYTERCMEMAASLGIPALRVKIEKLDTEISQKRIIDELKSCLRLTKVKK